MFLKKFMRLLFLLLISAVFVCDLSAQNCSPPVATVDLDINNVRARLFNNGALFWRGGGNMYNVPKRESDQQHSLFGSGIWVAGIVDGELRAAASTFGPWEFWPGPLDDQGNAPADCSVYDRMYKVSREDIQNYEASRLTTPDLLDWPYDLGAPVEDGDGNPTNYDLIAGDRPGIVGDQSIWWIMNDRGNEHAWSQAEPIGLEIQVMAFAFQRADPLNNATFYRYTIINKSDKILTDTYFGFWADPDLGNYNDDYVGSDPELDMGFVWNGSDDDSGGGGYGTQPPALGIRLYQGPLVNDDGVDNDEDGEVDEDTERLGLSKFLTYFNDGTVQGNPNAGEEAYKYLRGIWRDDTPITFGGNGKGFSNDATNFMYPGNPPDFWSEENIDDSGSRNTPGDRRFLMSTGPFLLLPLEAQTLVFGIIWAGGGDRFNSVQRMKAASNLLGGGGPNSVPDRPQLTFPYENSVDVNVRPDFWWSIDFSDQVTGGEIQVDTSGDFIASIIDTTTAPGSYSVTSDLLEGETTYYWRARSKNDLGVSDWSDIWSFTTAYVPQPPLVSSLISPLDSSIDLLYPIELKWGQSEFADLHILQFSESDRFPGNETQQYNQAGTSKILNDADLDIDTNYYWRVKGSNADGTSSWSEVWSFKTSAAQVGNSGDLPDESVAFSTYPNPVKDLLRIDRKSAVPVNIYLFDSTGRLVIKKLNHATASATIDLSTLPSGVFYIRVQDLNGKQESSKISVIN